jgi:hypothetical protein
MTVSKLVKTGLGLLVALAAIGGGVALWLKGPAPLSADEAEPLYQASVPAPEGPLAVYHLGHSLVGRDMPVMLGQLAPEGHRFNKQIGWGASLKEHWQHPDPVLKGYEEENWHESFRPAEEAINSAEYDVVVFTEAVELKHAIQYDQSPEYLALWAQRARAARPDVRLYLYETWHGLDDAEGWRMRLERDLPELWEGVVLYGALARDENRQPIYLIPGGQVIAELGRRVDAMGGLPGFNDLEDLFADNIHINDLGAYLIALTHYAVIYQRSPIGLPRDLVLADGTPADAPSPELALLMQQVVWDVVTGLPKTGITPT